MEVPMPHEVSWDAVPDQLLESLYLEMQGTLDSGSLPVEGLTHSFDGSPSDLPPAVVCSAPEAAPDVQQQQARCSLEQLDASIGAQERHFDDPHAAASDELQLLHQQLEASRAELHRLHHEVLLDGPASEQVRSLHTRLQVQRTKAALLTNPAVPGALVITEQPRQRVVFRGKSIEPFAVHLIGGGCSSTSSLRMKAALVASDPKVTTTEDVIENGVANVNRFQSTAFFQDLKVSTSTRMTPVHVKFAVVVPSASGELVTLESALSRPLIVITNESQWCDAAGKLLLLDVFGAGAPATAESSWPNFVNVANTCFLAATHQDPARPSRPMTYEDWAYLRQRYFGNASVLRQTDVTRFWGSFFGPVLSSLHFKRHIIALWSAGLIGGFTSKEQCTAHLSSHELGTFLVRFSESSPGLFSVAYVSNDHLDRVKHYLVNAQDLSLNRTLPDLLREKPQLQYALQQAPGTSTHNKYPRDAVFSAYYSKNRKSPAAVNTTGYVAI